MSQRIINSLLDQDLYKFSMAQVILHQFPHFWVKYKFKCRNASIHWTDAIVTDIGSEIEHFCSLTFNLNELQYLSSIRFLKPYFIDFLQIFKPLRKYIKVWPDNNELNIEIEGPWFLTIFFEVPILAIVNECYFRHTTNFSSIECTGIQKLEEKITLIQKEPFKFSDFGTRRRFSRQWHEKVIKRLTETLPLEIFTGTSNVYLASIFKLKPIGTMAHEFIQAGQAVDETTLVNSQKHMLQQWVNEYRGDLGIALTDTLGIDKFLNDFDLYFAKLYDGVRHDSADPFTWARRMIEHYKSLNINPKTKQLVFSDQLDFQKAAELNACFRHETNCAFGIGTNLTNDFEGVRPLQIVIKMIECNGKPVAKISDNPEKTMCDNQEFLEYLQSIL